MLIVHLTVPKYSGFVPASGQIDTEFASYTCTCLTSPPDLFKTLYAISDGTGYMHVDALLPGMKVILIHVCKPDGADVLVGLIGLLMTGCCGEPRIVQHVPSSS